MHRDLFPRASEVTYLDTAAEGLMLPQVEDCLAEYYRAKSRGTPGRKALYAVESEARGLVARLLGTAPANVALLASASDALSLLALSLDWNPGDRVIISDLEFPSNVLPWLRLKKTGLDVVVMPSAGGALQPERILERLTPRTRLVSLSLVSYKTGAYLPGLALIRTEAKKAGAVVCIDATQALGRCPVPLDAADFLVSSSFKWLLGPHGLGIVYVDPEFQRQFRPAGVGWYSVKNIFAADRFANYELKDGTASLPIGMPNFASMYAIRPGLELLLQAGVERLYRDLAPLVKRLREGVSELGLEMLTPEQPELSSGIVSFAHPQAEKIGAELEKQGIIVWAGDGRVRASVHLYNQMSDVEIYLQALQQILPQLPASTVGASI